MFLVFMICVALWGAGWAFGTSRQARWNMIFAVVALVVVAQLVLPDGHPLRNATGGSAAPWLMLLGAVAISLIYRGGLRKLQAKADAANAEHPPMTDSQSPARKAKFSDTELDRYARHIVLRELGGAGQRKLKDARVLVIGAGGLGAPALQYLAAAGVGTIGVIDDDIVDNSNLQRQVIHRDDMIGTAKVFSAKAAMEAQNPFITVLPYHRRLTDDIAADLFADFDVILDGTDNFDTRYLANRVAVEQGKPLISGALAQWEGQISVFDPANGAPCYQCIFPQAPAAHLAPSCSEVGVIAPLPGVLGAMMAVEALKVITGAGEPMRGAMLIYDALYGETRRFTVARRDDCPICGTSD